MSVNNVRREHTGFITYTVYGLVAMYVNATHTTTPSQTQTHDVTPSECAVWNETGREREKDRQRGNEVKTIKLNKRTKQNKKVEAAELHTHIPIQAHGAIAAADAVLRRNHRYVSLFTRAGVNSLSTILFVFFSPLFRVYVAVCAHSRAKRQNIFCVHTFGIPYIIRCEIFYV